MKNFIYLSILLTMLCSFSLEAKNKTHKVSLDSHLACELTCPSNWKEVSPSSINSPALLILQKPTSSFLSPSINITYQDNSFSNIDQMLKTLKKTYEDTGIYHWEHAGSIDTQAGTAFLTMIQGETKLGMACFLQAIVPYDDKLYFLTLTSSKQLFSSTYPTFLKMIRSFDLKTTT